MSREELRQAVVAEARSWLGTPYHLRAMVKGAGVDCGLLPYAVYRKFELVPEFAAEFFQDGWWLHTDEERYVLTIERFLKRLLVSQARRGFSPGLEAGNLVLVRSFSGRVYNHAAVITKWPGIVQAVPDRVVESDAGVDPNWQGKSIVSYDCLSNVGDEAA